MQASEDMFMFFLEDRGHKLGGESIIFKIKTILKKIKSVFGKKKVWNRVIIILH